MAYLMNTPSKTLATMEDVRAALNDGSINSYGGNGFRRRQTRGLFSSSIFVLGEGDHKS
jgi:hypothetical protein